jgi:hypothetical protein
MKNAGIVMKTAQTAAPTLNHVAYSPTVIAPKEVKKTQPKQTNVK